MSHTEPNLTPSETRTENQPWYSQVRLEAARLNQELQQGIKRMFQINLEPAFAGMPEFVTTAQPEQREDILQVSSWPPPPPRKPTYRSGNQQSRPHLQPPAYRRPTYQPHPPLAPPTPQYQPYRSPERDWLRSYEEQKAVLQNQLQSRSGRSLATKLIIGTLLMASLAGTAFGITKLLQKDKEPDKQGRDPAQNGMVENGAEPTPYPGTPTADAQSTPTFPPPPTSTPNVEPEATMEGYFEYVPLRDGNSLEIKDGVPSQILLSNGESIPLDQAAMQDVIDQAESNSESVVVATFEIPGTEWTTRDQYDETHMLFEELEQIPQIMSQEELAQHNVRIFGEGFWIREAAFEPGGVFEYLNGTDEKQLDIVMIDAAFVEPYFIPKSTLEQLPREMQALIQSRFPAELTRGVVEEFKLRFEEAIDQLYLKKHKDALDNALTTGDSARIPLLELTYLSNLTFAQHLLSLHQSGQLTDIEYHSMIVHLQFHSEMSSFYTDYMAQYPDSEFGNFASHAGLHWSVPLNSKNYSAIFVAKTDAPLRQGRAEVMGIVYNGTTRSYDTVKVWTEGVLDTKVYANRESANGDPANLITLPTYSANGYWVQRFGVGFAMHHEAQHANLSLGQLRPDISRQEGYVDLLAFERLEESWNRWIENYAAYQRGEITLEQAYEHFPFIFSVPGRGYIITRNEGGPKGRTVAKQSGVGAVAALTFPLATLPARMGGPDRKKRRAVQAELMRKYGPKRRGPNYR